MVICDKIPINWYFIVQEKFFNLQKLNSINMKKIFILLFVSLALFSCEKEEDNKIFEYQLLPSENVSKPFSCLGEKRTITFTIIQKTLIDDILDSEVPIIPKDVSIEFDKTLFSDIETKIKGDQVVLNITSNINKVYSVTIATDGAIGNIILTYTNNKAKLNELVNEFINQRRIYYQDLVKRKSTNQKFLKSWLNKVDIATEFVERNSK